MHPFLRKLSFSFQGVWAFIAGFDGSDLYQEVCQACFKEFREASEILWVFSVSQKGVKSFLLYFETGCLI